MRIVVTRLATVATFALAAVGCSDDPVDVDDTSLSGGWTMIVDVTAATGACAGEELEPVDTIQVNITQQGNSMTITGPFGDAGSQNLNGNLTSGVVSVGGSYPEDGGTTTATHTLTVVSADSMSGTEAWSWTGPGGSCPGSTSDVAAFR